MPHSFGIRARTRHMFKKGFKGAFGLLRLCGMLGDGRIGQAVDGMAWHYKGWKVVASSAMGPEGVARTAAKQRDAGGARAGRVMLLLQCDSLISPSGRRARRMFGRSMKREGSCHASCLSGARIIAILARQEP